MEKPCIAPIDKIFRKSPAFLNGSRGGLVAQCCRPTISANEGVTMRVKHTIALLMAAAVLGVFVGPRSEAQQSRVISGNGRSAMDCARLVVLSDGDSRVQGNGGRVISNGCGELIEATWCYMDGECQRDSGNVWTIGAGRNYPVRSDSEIRWAACRGANTVSFEKGSQGSRYICMAPVAKPLPLAAPLNSANSVTSRAGGGQGTKNTQQMLAKPTQQRETSVIAKPVVQGTTSAPPRAVGGPIGIPPDLKLPKPLIAQMDAACGSLFPDVLRQAAAEQPSWSSQNAGYFVWRMRQHAYAKYMGQPEYAFSGLGMGTSTGNGYYEAALQQAKQYPSASNRDTACVLKELRRVYGVRP